jgi:hypothetical protein
MSIYVLNAGLPSWIRSDEDELLYGEAIAYSTSPQELSLINASKMVCIGFINVRKDSQATKKGK